MAPEVALAYTTTLRGGWLHEICSVWDPSHASSTNLNCIIEVCMSRLSHGSSFVRDIGRVRPPVAAQALRATVL